MKLFQSTPVIPIHQILSFSLFALLGFRFRPCSGTSFLALRVKATRVASLENTRGVIRLRRLIPGLLVTEYSQSITPSGVLFSTLWFIL